MTTSPKEKIGTTEIRIADSLDHAYIMDELEKFNDWFISDVNLFDDKEYAAKFLDVLINENIVMISERIADNGDIIPTGFIIGFVTPHIYNPRLKTLTELFWWVNPEYRKTRAGLMLIKSFLKWGKENGCDWINATRQANSPIKRETYERLGFRFQEESYVMEVDSHGSSDSGRSSGGSLSGDGSRLGS